MSLEKQKVSYEDAKQKLLDVMHPRETYSASEIGEIIYGKWKCEIGGHKFPYRPQGLALMSGKVTKRMKEEGLMHWGSRSGVVGFEGYYLSSKGINLCKNKDLI